MQEQRSLKQIAGEIRESWKNVSYAAQPYLIAMLSLNNIQDQYYLDSAEDIVLRFLGNASTWKGEDAKRIKKELKKMVNLK